MTYSSCFSLLDTGEACHRCCKEKTGKSKCESILYCLTYSSCFSLLDTGEACHRCCKEKTGKSKCESINNTLLPNIFKFFLFIRYR